METVKRQGDRISELEAQLKSNKPTDEKPAEGKFMGNFHFVMSLLGLHDSHFCVYNCISALERVLHQIQLHKIQYMRELFLNLYFVCILAFSLTTG